MSRKAANPRKLNICVGDKRKVIQLSEETGYGVRKVAKLASEQLGREISHVSVYRILQQKDRILKKAPVERVTKLKQSRISKFFVKSDQ